MEWLNLVKNVIVVGKKTAGTPVVILKGAGHLHQMKRPARLLHEPFAVRHKGLVVQPPASYVSATGAVPTTDVEMLVIAPEAALCVRRLLTNRTKQFATKTLYAIWVNALAPFAWLTVWNRANAPVQMMIRLRDLANYVAEFRLPQAICFLVISKAMANATYALAHSI
ncbi:uncharacterized protein LOC113372606 [Ctenocephalides felis]|uniref:uncharacterized protein LOC113372606 n=1 Tax=Ctenocephalides felis TaxID=7515 RepID=UPI000E6E29BB|nr:uncharacterized protein LOC113372606 [Ctenocephalides felis]